MSTFICRGHYMLSQLSMETFGPGSDPWFGELKGKVKSNLVLNTIVLG
jgi:hypothetical protein